MIKILMPMFVLKIKLLIKILNVYLNKYVKQIKIIVLHRQVV